MNNLILAIETSCDESAVALISCGGTNIRPSVVSEKIASQIALHAQYGGVVPELAAREHLTALPTLVSAILSEQSNLVEDRKLSAIAVTCGPGLKGSLLMGVNFAKGFGLANEIPVYGINHIEGHLLSPLMSHARLEFPYLAVIVSGGHTEILEVRGVADYHLIERTADDAAGEAFDKSAALMGVQYPGGAELSRNAEQYRQLNPDADCESYRVSASKSQLSFSGLKTSFRVALDKLKRANVEVDVNRACAAVESAIVDTLYARIRAACSATGISRIGLSGGVAANTYLRSRLCDLGEVFPAEHKWCGDNAAMIGFVAGMRITHGFSLADTTIRARWPVEEMSG